MSIYGALLTGVSGLSSNSTALTVSSSNISNANTTGYKDSSAAFSTLLAEVSGTSAAASVGVSASTQQSVTSQGDLSATTSTTDLAISGQGFFITSSKVDGTNVAYTRAGDFSPTKAGDLKNSSGLYLLGYGVSTDAAGTETVSTKLSTINLDNKVGIAQQSKSVTLTGNLESTATVTGSPNFSTSATVYDSQGGTQSFAVSFTKSATANSWTYTISYTGDPTHLTGSATVASGAITFNADGSLASVTDDGTGSGGGTVTGGTLAMTIPWDTAASGFNTQPISFNFGSIGGINGFTQYATTSTATSKADGAAYGSVSDYSISTDGTVTATYTNGLTRDLYKIPVAMFACADGLTAISGTAYVASNASGPATIVTAGNSGSGAVKSQRLEDSTVDLATELTDLITTQRAYQACSKIVTTSTNMLDVLVNMGS